MIRLYWFGFLILLGIPGELLAQNDSQLDPVVLIHTGEVSSGQIGAGFLTGKQGDELFILTALHVISSAPNQINLTFRNNQTALAEVVNSDEGLDIAVIKCKAPFGFNINSSFKFAQNVPVIREELIIVGHPPAQKWRANYRNRVDGLKHGSDDRLLETTTDYIVDGYSGGPILNNRNELLGILTHVNEHFAIGIKSSYLEMMLSKKHWNIPTGFMTGESGISNETQQESYSDDHAGQMIYVKGGQFAMGSNDGLKNEKPIHKVSLSSFFMGKYEVTHSQYVVFLNEKGNREEGGKAWCQEKIYEPQSHILWKNGTYYVEEGFRQYPMIYVTWYGARAYCDWLSEKTGHDYRLPTEAEWEFAARGGQESQNETYSGSSNLNIVAWHKGNAEGTPHPVGRMLGNEIALHDMSGNVWEWCLDWAGDYSRKFQQNPIGPKRGELRVLRGGAWSREDSYHRVSKRSGEKPTDGDNRHGFRVARSLR